MALQLLIPLDSTEFSRQVLPRIRRLFAPSHYHLHLLHVAAPPRDNYDPLARPALLAADYSFYTLSVEQGVGHARVAAQPHPMYGADELAPYRQALERDLETELAVFEAGGYQVTASVHFGDPASEIAAFAEHEPVDLIAMATHGRTGLGRFLHGSVAQAVLQRTHTPLLLIRLDEQDKADLALGEKGELRTAGRGRRTASLLTLRKERMMDWDQIRMNWRTYMSQAKSAWPQLHDAELEVIGGDRTKLIDKVRDAQSLPQEEAEIEVDAWAANLGPRQSDRSV